MLVGLGGVQRATSADDPFDYRHREDVIFNLPLEVFNSFKGTSPHPPKSEGKLD